MKTIILACLLTTACATNLPSNMHVVTWAQTGHSDSPGVPGPVACTATISHPCPFLLYTTLLTIDGDQLTWSDAAGGTDLAGVPADQRAPVIETEGTALAKQGSLVLAQRGDDGGLRHAVVLVPASSGGWEGDVTWSLFTVAGNTAFHVTIQ